MKNFRNPWWLIPVTLLPVAILFWIFCGTFQLIESLLTKEQIVHWVIFGAGLGLLWLIHVIYTFVMIVKHRMLDTWYSLVTLLTYAAFLYLYFTYYEELIPSNVPGWMVAENMVLYAGSFIMPTLLHSMVILVLSTIRIIEKEKPWHSILLSAVIPIAWYIFFHTILPLWRRVHPYETHLLVILIMTATVIFLFFLIRGVYLLATRKENWLKRYELLWKIIIALVFPLAGLFANNDLLFNFIFGNFSNPWFYTVAAINGVAVCLPDRKNKYYRLVLFVIRSITFTYIIYFFLVFLPFLPLSVIAIVAFGLGFLMLTPLVLMVFQTNMLVNDFGFLYNHYSKRTIHALFIAAVMTIPLTVTAVYVQDKNILRRALAYVYEPDFEKEDTIPVHSSSLQRVLRHIRASKNNNRQAFNIPFLTSYYNWIALDNLTLSDRKIKLLDKIFSGHSSPPDLLFRLAEHPRSDNITTSKVDVSSVYDTNTNVWTSEIDLSITNADPWQSEYVTSFELPDGAWITHYYLWMDDEKVPGILTEKKAATWIYQQVTNFRQDPGILYYTSGNTVAFRVFPFAPMETRMTGFRVIHKEPITIQLEEHLLQLGWEEISINGKEVTYSAGQQTAYIPAEVKKHLESVNRKPVYHFILDCSTGKKKYVDNFTERIKNYITKNKIDNENVHYVLTNAGTVSYSATEVDIASAVQSLTFTGGFFLERAIHKILFHQINHPGNTYPVIVVVTDGIENAIVTKDFKDWKMSFPESDFFFVLDKGETLIPHDLTNDPLSPSPHKGERYPVAAWPDRNVPVAFVRLDNQPCIVVNPGSTRTESTLTEHHWASALALQGRWLNHIFYPARTDTDRLDLIKGSFKAQVMMPATSFIALENDAQRSALQKKQEEVLNAHKSLDVGEEGRMSEPGIFLLLLLLLIPYHSKNKLGLYKHDG